MPGKYTPLEQYLKNSVKNDLTLSFADIERILNDRLPKSAKEYSVWWNNELEGSHVQAHSWMDAGWKVETLDLGRKQVRFRKG